MAPDTPLPELGARALRDRLASGALTATALAEACLARIAAREDTVRAWAHLDPGAVLAEAGRLDGLRASGGPLGPLHGLPVGVKDIIDTGGVPTENGCPLDAGRVPGKDAEAVRRLKAAGALVLGKTVTTELAFLHPSRTRNPVNPDHTPGGSSAGSAAAVADGMVPLAIGTQTGGSVVRPASFCGVTGFKPSFGAIPTAGALVQSPSLDTLGVFARDPSGAALLAGALMTGGLGPEVRADGPPRLAVVELPGWDRADPVMRDAFSAVADRLGAARADLPGPFAEAATERARINGAEMAYYFRRYMAEGAGRLGPETRAGIEAGQKVCAEDYLAARAYQASLPGALAPLFGTFDALICPAAPGPAPEGLGSTGDAIFNGLWTLAGTPAITLPLMATPGGLPMGVQLVGPVGGDAGLIAAAEWLWRELG